MSVQEALAPPPATHAAMAPGAEAVAQADAPAPIPEGLAPLAPPSPLQALPSVPPAQALVTSPLARGTVPAGTAPVGKAAPGCRNAAMGSKGLQGLAGFFGLTRRLARNGLFWVTVVLPTACSALYFGAVASDLYVSDAKFVVRMPQRQAGPSLVGALMQGNGFMRSQDDTFSVHEYMLSRDALAALDSALSLRAAFSAPGVDRFNRFPALWADDSFESLFRYYGQRVSVSFDAATSITTLRATAFTAADAHAINVRLLGLGEALVNQINTRGRNDLVRYAQNEVDQAEQRAKDAAAALASFRNQRAVFDPERQSTLQLQSATRLQEELLAAQGQLAQVLAAAPQNPQLPALRLRVQQLQADSLATNARVTGGKGSLTSNAADFERLALERSFADRQLAGALSALEGARNDARRQQLYLERIVQANLPDLAIEPRRLRNVAATLVTGLLMWGALSLLLAAVREHRH